MSGGTRTLLGNEQYDALYQLTEEEHMMLQKCFLDIALDIYTYCKENGLICMLCGGSVLGAVRHQGFIPWDDDIDLAMPREDYVFFIEHFEEYYGKKYKIFAPLGRHNATHLFTKVSKRDTLLEDIYTAGSKYKTGIAVDVFPIENVPANRLHRKIRGWFSNLFAFSCVSEYLYENRNRVVDSVYYSSVKRKMIYDTRLAIGKFMSFRGYQWWYRKFDGFANYRKKTNLYTIPTGRGHYIGEIQNGNVFFPVQMMKFENNRLPIMANPDAYLKKIYGEYMEIPDESKRERHYYTKVKM